MNKFQLDCIIKFLEFQCIEYKKYIEEIHNEKEVVAILEKLLDNVNETLKVFKQYRKVLFNEKG